MIKEIYKKIVPENLRIAFRLKLIKLSRVFLIGKNVSCNICNSNFRKFLSKGIKGNKRSNALCPVCFSLERTRLLYFYLKSETQIFKGKHKILHVAPENCLSNKFIENKNYFDVDINSNLARYQADISALNFNSDEFDFIICSHVLAHVIDEEKAIEELFRVLKQGCSAYILTLIDFNIPDSIQKKDFNNFSNNVLLRENDLERLHGSNFIEKLKRENVKVEQIDYLATFSQIEIEKFKLGDNSRELIFKCTKI